MDEEVKEVISAIAKGKTEGFLNWSESRISDFIRKFKNKELRFLEDDSVIDRVKKDYKSGEMQFYEAYVQDKENRRLLGMGLTLRNSPTSRVNHLRLSISKKYGSSGLHVAYLAQNEMLIRYIGSLVPNIDSVNELKIEIANILDNVDSHAVFIGNTDTIDRCVEKVKTKIDAHSPKVFIIDGVRSCSEKARKVFDSVKDDLDNYSWSIETTANREVFVFRKNRL